MDVHKAPHAMLGVSMSTTHSVHMVKKRNGTQVAFDMQKIQRTLSRAMAGYEHRIQSDDILGHAIRTMFDGITTSDVMVALAMAATSAIEREPAYGVVAARLMRMRLYKEVSLASSGDYQRNYRETFVHAVVKACAEGLLDQRMGQEFDLEYLAQQLVIERDDLILYTGMQTLYDRYLLRYQGKRYETIQAFWMRIAMGLALGETEHKTTRAVEFYNVLSRLLYVPSTPTLFHAGLPIAQLSSCYLTTVEDDLGHIFKCLGDNAQLSKWAGGIGTDWTNIRATGSYIKSIKATSQGVIPYLKIANDVVVAITRSGIRRGGKCAYLEVWHFDIDDFIDLRRNTGDERRRTHDMNTAVWIPDLFMERVQQDGTWTLFSPEEVPGLHDLYGAAFKHAYEQYEVRARQGQMRLSREMPARTLWRKILTRLFETGHPWITFKDPCNIRSPQDHAGVVHSSNLCTEITLNTSADETAVCNLGSINLERLVGPQGLDTELTRQTVRSALRMLDNVIDLNFYPTAEAAASNKKHRPVGMGLMGFQDALCHMGLSFDDPRTLTFADESMEFISYCAIEASALLAQERGAYGSYKGSKWDRGIFPCDTLDLLEQERGQKIHVSRTKRLDWDTLKAFVRQYGMRNSNTMAIAPTATISTIAGTYPSIEPMYKNMYVKSNVSGEFTIINSYLVKDLQDLGLWNQEMVDLIKFKDGDISSIESIPADIRARYKTAFGVDPVWLVRISAERGKWIDQSQSHNVFMQGVSGKKLEEVYMAAWTYGLKTLYYLRTLGASGIEKSTLDAKTYGFTQKREQTEQVSSTVSSDATSGSSCKIEDPTCESCQ